MVYILYFICESLFVFVHVFTLVIQVVVYMSPTDVCHLLMYVTY